MVIRRVLELRRHCFTVDVKLNLLEVANLSMFWSRAQKENC